MESVVPSDHFATEIMNTVSHIRSQNVLSRKNTSAWDASQAEQS